MAHYLMLIGIVVCSAGAQVMMKVASKQPFFKLPWLGIMFVALALYGSSYVLYSFVLRNDALSRVGPITTVGVVFLVVLAGIIFFGEVMNAKQIVGCILGAVAVVLLLM